MTVAMDSDRRHTFIELCNILNINELWDGETKHKRRTQHALRICTMGTLFATIGQKWVASLKKMLTSCDAIRRSELRRYTVVLLRRCFTVLLILVECESNVLGQSQTGFANHCWTFRNVGQCM